MKVTVALDHRFSRTPDGTVWTRTFFGPSFWRRYLEVFDHVEIVARVLDVDAAEDQWQRVTNKEVSVVGLPHYIGPVGYLRQARRIRAAARQVPAKAEAIILRVSSQISSCLEPSLRRMRHPYGVEVVADPYDVFSSGAVRHPLRPFFRWWFPMQLRQICRNASAASYVTAEALQKRYPPSPSAYTTNYSSVELPPDAFAAAPRPARIATPLRIVSVGTLEELYKGQDILIEAIALCCQSGREVSLTLVGDGRRKNELRMQAERLGIARRVIFAGEMPGSSAVRAQLDQAHLFVLPSRQEGLPRAMLEAMARGLPCIGSSVGGIPELLDPSVIVPPGNVKALKEKICEVFDNPVRMAELSAFNLSKAQEYREEILRERRHSFYSHLRNQTQSWQSKGSARSNRGPQLA